jgi:uncharacterized protein
MFEGLDRCGSVPEPDSAQCRVLVVKVAERCNLNCSYCYMFNGGDLSYRRRPAIMSTETVDAMMSRVVTHCRRHNLSKFTFILHGGEPLLAPKSFYRYFVERARTALADKVEPRFALQTNGTLISKEWCLLFLELGIGIGVSLDGPKDINDRQRLDHKGRGSFDRVLAGWDLAVSYGLKPGLLAVIDLNADPLDVFGLVKELYPSTVDFLLPDATHDKLPPGYSKSSRSTDYADWLLKIFDAWIADGNPNLKIRVFSNIMRSILGWDDGFDALGTGDNEVLVVESDGELQPVDVLRFCSEGITLTPYNVATDELDDAFQHPMVRLYHKSHKHLCSTCNVCTLRDICGGGFLPHRYSAINGFDNPSVYCRDLIKLITGVHHWFLSQLPADVLDDWNLEPVGEVKVVG